MQPYFFPYIGYFQLMRSVDHFVFFDDVQYIDRGWVNRNRLLSNGAPIWWTWPVADGPRDAAIRDRRYAAGDRDRASALARLKALYGRAPHVGELLPLAEACLAYPDPCVATFNQHLLTQIAARLGIGCTWSSSSWAPSPVRGQERLLALCRALGGSTYVNLPGGVRLYDAAAFRRADVQLKFVRPLPMEYPQLRGPHVPHLSILDVLAFQGFAGTAALLDACELVPAAEAAP